MTSVKVLYNSSSIIQKEYSVDWSIGDITRLMQSIKNTKVIQSKNLCINCKSQDAYMIVTRFFIAPKSIY